MAQTLTLDGQPLTEAGCIFQVEAGEQIAPVGLQCLVQPLHTLPGQPRLEDIEIHDSAGAGAIGKPLARHLQVGQQRPHPVEQFAQKAQRIGC